ncbi:TIM barrel protein [Alteromonas genovensis]|uniref:TIM barrel protein n=1 Tax=Alteromonas genovensis TaxID=471225 RepID=UPI002FE28857
MSNSIFVSSSCVNNRKIAKSVEELAVAGFSNIELSGGTNLYADWKTELLQLKEKYGLNYRCHNYFPPPKEHFVLNLSASDDSIRERSISHVVDAISLSQELGAKEYGIHAGFRFLPEHTKLGQQFDSVELQDEDDAISRFAEAWNELKPIALEKGISLYVENNVFSSANKRVFGDANPFLATDTKSIAKLNDACEINLLLDIAHLKVSCVSLSISFENELNALMPQANYLHFSDNNGLADSNQGFTQSSGLYHTLKNYEYAGKTVTLEVYDGSLQETLDAVNAL